MTDLLDERLASAGERWQSEQLAPPAVPLERLDERLPRRTDWRAVLAVGAAAVLVISGGIGVVVLRATGDDSSGPSDRPSSTPTLHGEVPSGEIVPWRKLMAEHSQLGHRVKGTLVTPYDGIVATGHIGGDFHPGDTLVFVVTLESSTAIALHPCPNYSIEFGKKSSQTGQLNCAQVPYYASVQGPHGHLSAFRPTLPANTPVPFRMRMKVPDERGRQKVLWTLTGPTAMPGFYGIVHVS